MEKARDAIRALHMLSLLKHCALKQNLYLLFFIVKFHLIGFQGDHAISQLLEPFVHSEEVSCDRSNWVYLFINLNKNSEKVWEPQSDGLFFIRFLLLFFLIRGIYVKILLPAFILSLVGIGIGIGYDLKLSASASVSISLVVVLVHSAVVSVTHLMPLFGYWVVHWPALPAICKRYAQCTEGLRFLPLIDRMRDANASFGLPRSVLLLAQDTDTDSQTDRRLYKWTVGQKTQKK